MSVATNNSAGRLYAILSSLIKLQGSNTAMNAVLQSLGRDSGGLLEFYRSLIELSKLVDQAESELRATADIQHELYLAPFPRIRKALAINMPEATWQTFSVHITESDVTVLGFCAEALSRSNAENLIDDQELSELREDVDGLAERVMASSIDQELKVILLGQLELLRRAIFDYRIRGVVRLQEALAASLGTIALNNPLFAEAKDTEEVRGFAKVLKRLGKLIGLAVKAKPLIEPVVKYFIGSGHDGDQGS